MDIYERMFSDGYGTLGDFLNDVLETKKTVDKYSGVSAHAIVIDARLNKAIGKLFKEALSIYDIKDVLLFGMNIVWENIIDAERPDNRYFYIRH